jgi:hypothetical protein
LSKQQDQGSKRGLASASDDTRERVARAGGEAPHKKRGLQAASSETRRSVARKGGLARGEQRRKTTNNDQKTSSFSTEEEIDDEADTQRNDAA